MKTNQQFNELVRKPPVSIPEFSIAARAGDPRACEKLCASLGWAAFSCPHAITAVYDAVASSWLEAEIQPAIEHEKKSLLAYPSVPVPDSLIAAFWAMIEDADKGYDATSITVRTASLATYLDPGFGLLAEKAAAAHPGCTDVDRRVIPTLYTIEMVSDSPAGSLKNDLYRMWVDNNFDPEVLDRDVIGLAELEPHLRYLNTRILQMHDVWHLVAGYETSALHEIAISAFQLAQFGHNYSSHFLAVILMMVKTRSPEGFHLIFQTIAEAWKHGRETPSMMDIEWQEVWKEKRDVIRSTYGICPFESKIPPNLLEMAAT